MTLSDLAQQLGCNYVGAATLAITGVAGIKEAVAGDITFLNNPKYARYLNETAASAIILADAGQIPNGKAALISATPYLTFARAIEVFYPAAPAATGIHPQAVVSPRAQLGKNVSIGAFTVIGDDVVLGDDVTLHAHCVIYARARIGAGSLLHSHCVVREDCELGERVILQNHVTIGSDGFGYAPTTSSTPGEHWYKIRQAGRVIIEADVEIGAGSTIDRATIGATIIRAGAKIDNLVQIGHGSTVGRETLLCAQVGLAGSSHIGNNVILAGQVGVAGHLEIADGVMATAQTGIPSSLETPRQVVSGYPAVETQVWRKAVAVFAKLPQYVKELRQLRARLEALEQQQNAANPAQSPSAQATVRQVSEQHHE